MPAESARPKKSQGKADFDPRLRPFLDELAGLLAAAWLRDHDGQGKPEKLTSEEEEA